MDPWKIVGADNHNHSNRSYTIWIMMTGHIVTRNSKHIKLKILFFIAFKQWQKSLSAPSGDQTQCFLHSGQVPLTTRPQRQLICHRSLIQVIQVDWHSTAIYLIYETNCWTHTAPSSDLATNLQHSIDTVIYTSLNFFHKNIKTTPITAEQYLRDQLASHTDDPVDRILKQYKKTLHR